MAEPEPRIVRETSKTGLYIATSPDIPGLLVAESTAEERERKIPIAIAELRRAKAAGPPVQE